MTGQTMAEAQASLDRFCATIGDDRERADSTVRELAQAEPLLPLPPVPYPATISAECPVDSDATIAFRGARYSVPPGFIGAQLRVRQRLGTPTLEVVTRSGALVAVHRAGSGLVRTPEHRAALEALVLAGFTSAPACERKGNHPPGPAARAAADALRRGEDREVRVDLARYAALVEAAR
ncbi:MAG: hypothetical protein ABSG37_10705 [Candidatus Limnocylindrales bacterium]|jgi:hypothetical protein